MSSEIDNIAKIVDKTLAEGYFKPGGDLDKETMEKYFKPAGNLESEEKPTSQSFFKIGEDLDTEYDLER